MVELNCLPDEILIEILTRLPIKSLVICACTSKWLLAFITSSSFMDAQFKKNTQYPFIFLRYFTKSTKKEYFSLEPDNGTFTGHFDLVDMPFNSSYDDDDGDGCSLSVVGLCNGLICLSDDPLNCPYPNNIILWNPSIRKRLTLPRPVDVITFGGHDYNGFQKGLGFGFDCLGLDFSYSIRVGLGFGFDHLRNDFKVVRLVYCESIKAPPYVDIYTISSGSWRAIEVSVPTYHICRPEYSQCFVNGAVHWPGWKDTTWSVIVTFDMQDEVFGEIELPVCLANTCDCLSTCLMVRNCKDMLALIKMSSGSNSSSVWVMREYGAVESWSEICRLDLPDEYPRPKTFGFRKNDEILVFAAEWPRVSDECRHLMLLVDRNGQVVKVLGMIDGVSRSFSLDAYVESLALLKEGIPVMENHSQINNGFV